MPSKLQSQIGAGLGSALGGIVGTVAGGPLAGPGAKAAGRAIGTAVGALPGLLQKSKAKKLAEEHAKEQQRAPYITGYQQALNLAPSTVGARTSAQQAMMAPAGSSGVVAGADAATRAAIARGGQREAAAAMAAELPEILERHYRERGIREREMARDIRRAEREEDQATGPVQDLREGFEQLWKGPQRKAAERRLEETKAARTGPIEQRKEWLRDIAEVPPGELVGLSDDQINAMYADHSKRIAIMSSGRPRRPAARPYSAEYGDLGDVIEKDNPSEGASPIVPRGANYEVEDVEPLTAWQRVLKALGGR